MHSAIDLAFDTAQDLFGFSQGRGNSMWNYGHKNSAKVLSGEINARFIRIAWTGFMVRHAIDLIEKLQREFNTSVNYEENSPVDNPVKNTSLVGICLRRDATLL